MILIIKISTTLKIYFIIIRMSTLNSQFYSSCKPSDSKIIKLKKDIFTIKDFFVDFDSAKSFLSNLNRWECDMYDNTSKSGMESKLPLLTGYYLYDKSSLKKNIINFALGSVTVNFLFHGQMKKFNKTNSSNGTFDLPHHDYIDLTGKQKKYVCLINLNNYPIYTNFWTFNGKSLMTDNSYDVFINKVNKEYEDERKIKKIPENLSLNCSIKYYPNQALIYNASLLHNANIKEKHSYSSPRTSLRIYFESDPIIINNINYV